MSRTIQPSELQTQRCPKCGWEMGDRTACYHCKEFGWNVIRGLRWCGIVPLSSADVEKPWSPLAVLGPLGLSNSGRGYWCVDGLVPMEVAEELYADPAGRELIRVSGDCTCPSPRERVKWRTSDGRTVVKATEEVMFDQMIAKGHIKASEKAAYVFNDDPVSVGARPFVGGYHIDGDLGLRVFVDVLRKHGLCEPATRAVQ